MKNLKASEPEKIGLEIQHLHLYLIDIISKIKT